MLLVLTLLLAFSSLHHVCGESIIDESECKLKSISCPREGDPNYAKYCCAAGDGYLTCCNPYLSIGLGISIPLIFITLLVVLIILIVCVLLRCNRTKYYPGSVAYTYRRVREEREGAAYDAPPSYSSSQGQPPAYAEAEVHIRDDQSTQALQSPTTLGEERNNPVHVNPQQ